MCTSGGTGAFVSSQTVLRTIRMVGLALGNVCGSVDLAPVDLFASITGGGCNTMGNIGFDLA